MNLYLFDRDSKTGYGEHQAFLVAADNKAEAAELAISYEMEHNGGIKREECQDWHEVDCRIIGEASSDVAIGVLLTAYRHG